MSQIAQHNLLFIALCCIGLVLLIAEYLLLGWFPSYIQVLSLPRHFLEKLNHYMPFLRLGLPFLFALTLMSVQSDPLYQVKDRKSPRKLSSKGILISSITCIGALCFIYLLPHMGRFEWRYGYPLVLMTIAVLFPVIIKSILSAPSWGIPTPRRKLKRKYGFNLRLHNGWINITQPQRGTLLIGGPGSGKTYSVVEGFIEQAVAMGYTGIIYDFKFPSLTEVVIDAFQESKSDVRLYIINFSDLSRSHRLNPLEPQNLPSLAYAIEFAQAIFANLVPESLLKQDFWMRSATAFFTSVIWFLKKYHPRQCSLPHAVALICQVQYERLINLLKTDPETAGLIASLAIAIENEANKQVAGVLATIQTALAKLNTPEIAWVMSDSDFSLDLNNPNEKKMLLIGNDADLPDALSPAISLIISVALKQMNRPGKHPSLLLLDEAPTLFIPKLELIPATGRSNKISTIYVAQDLSQIVKGIGKTNTEVLLGTLSNQIFGKASNQHTAEYVSSMFGKEEKEVINKQQNRSQKAWGFQESLSYQKRDMPLIRPQEVIDLSIGEFVGVTVGTRNEWFRGMIKRKKAKELAPVPAFIEGAFDPQRNFERIHHEVKVILGT